MKLERRANSITDYIFVHLHLSCHQMQVYPGEVCIVGIV